MHRDGHVTDEVPADRALLARVARCPRCAGELSTAWGCASCGVEYPVLGGVPCLLPAFDAWQRRWAEELAVIHAEVERTLAVFAEASRRPGILPRTRARLARQAALTSRMRAEIDDALAPVGPPRSPDGPREGFRPLDSVHLLHRDWGWPGSEENARALACVQNACKGPSARVLVLGAGAGRLAYDFHVTSGAELTVAVDVDPLVSLVGQRVCAGEEIPFTEGNSAALDEAALDAPRLLRAPRGAAAGLHFVLADGLAPPFRAGAFETVITPWFIDLVPPDLRDFLGVLDRMLAVGGQWLNYGPLIYPPARHVGTRFTLEEIRDVAALAGFVVEGGAREVLPYSVSPLGGRGRVESCISFRAVKGERAAAADGEAPAWLVLPYLPVPAFSGPPPAIEPNGAVALVAGLVDGVRSVDDITREVVARSGTAAPGVKDMVRFCLGELHPASARSRR
jgi:N2227-like protein